LATLTLFGAIRVTYRLVVSGSMPRSIRMTGIFASCAFFREASQPEPSVADSRITSTPESTKDENASICDFWSRLVAGAYFRSKPAALVKVSCMFCSFALRQSPSGPTATNPIVVSLAAPPVEVVEPGVEPPQAVRESAMSPALATASSPRTVLLTVMEMASSSRLPPTPGAGCPGFVGTC